MATTNNSPTATQQAGERPAMIQRRFVFGVRNDVKDGVHYVDEFTVVWAAGKNIVVYNTQFASQKFIPCSDTCETITAMAVSANRRQLAVAESGETPCIVIYAYDPQNQQNKFRRKRVLAIPDVGSKEYVSLSFSQDGRNLVSQGGFPEWNLVYWNIDKQKPMGMVSVTEKASPSQDRRLLNQCSISPKDHTLICVSGNGHFKFFRYADNTIRPSPGGIKGDPMNYLAHLWLPPEDRMIVSTDNGDLLLIENCEYRYPLPLSPSDGVSIDSLVAYSKGFICGGDMGLVTIFERSEDKELYRKMRTIKVESGRKDADGLAGAGDDSLKVLAFSLTPPPTEEYLSLMTSNKQLLMLNLNSADYSKADDHVCDTICQPFHAGPITGLDICIRKPLLVTCGKDRNIFLWNYKTNVVEITKHFATEILSVAIHPSGLHLLVGFPDKLRFMNIYGDDIREFKNFGIRSCSECRFSNGGQFFAAMHSTIIHVYFTYTCELLSHLRGHNGKIRKIFFAQDDTRVISVGVDGAVFEFSLCDFHKVNDHVIKAISYNAVTGDSGTVWVAGNDKKLRQLERAHLAPQNEFDLKSAIQCLAQSVNLKLLFAGCEDGSVKVFNTFMAERAVTDKNVEHRERSEKLDILIESHTAHSGPVTRVAMTFDESLVATVGEDGMLTLWDIVAPHRGARKEPEFAEEILIDKKDLDERTRNISDLQNRVSELKQRIVQQQYKRSLKHTEKIQELNDKFAEEKEKQEQQLRRLRDDKNEQHHKFEEHLQEMDVKHKEDVDKLRQDYAAKIQHLQEKAKKLQLEIDQEQAEHQREKQRREQQFEEEKRMRHENQRAALAKVTGEIGRLNLEMDQTKRDADEICDLIELETDSEILELKERYEQRMKYEQEQSTNLRTDNTMMLNSENQRKADLDAKRSDIAEKLKQQQSLHTQIKGFDKDIEALQHELRERSETIADKDKRIYDLRKKNQELEKFKFVLDYKIRELKSQIDPRDEEIRLARAKYQEMEEESERYLHSNESLVLQIRGLKLKLDGQLKEIENLKQKLTVAAEYQSRLWTELSDLHDEQNPRKLKDLTKAMYYKHTSNTNNVAATKILGSRTTEDAQREYNRERDYLERTVTGLKTKIIKDADTNRTDRSRIINENVTLIKEINELRREVRTLHMSKRGGESTATRDEAQRELEIQRAEIRRLRGRVDELERQLHAAGKAVSVATPPVI